MELRLLVYNELEPGRRRAAFERVCEALRHGDFRAAQAKKLAPTPYYRAELSAADRLLFTFGSYDGQACLLLLEIIENHAYDKSRFLRGAAIDESRLEPLDRPPEGVETPAFAFAQLSPQRSRFHLLDKALSFDDEQDAVVSAPLPMILIGSAGSGKTALMIERLKQIPGELAYVTRSPYLAEHAARLYHAFDYDNPEQEVEFLSFRELLESIRVPAGRPVTDRQTAAWVRRHPDLPARDARLVVEEFGGVLTGTAVDRPWLSREDYQNLGVRRSIFLAEQRGRVYDLFERYLRWLTEEGLYDPNVEAWRALESVTPVYDAVVLDEVQDLTNIQIHLALSTLKKPDQFILGGDANQLVHPNFFSWSALKTMFYEQRTERPREITRFLCANYRNAPEVTALANRILRLKNRRFGSVDRESTRLALSLGRAGGSVRLVPERDADLRELDLRTRRNARAAVIVLRDEDKAAAREMFGTPLLFSVQEAKGLEYETVIAVRLIGAADRQHRKIAEGIRPDDLDGEETLDYARARDKTDKSLDAFKFFINALYVTVTRAVRHVVWVEPRTDHPMLTLLGLREAASAAAHLPQHQSSAEEWRQEARRLDLQGHEEQAEAIRRMILEQQPIPWTVVTPEKLVELDREALDPARFNKQAKDLLFQYTVVYEDFVRMEQLARAGYKRAIRHDEERASVAARLCADYREKRFGSLRQKIEKYGPDFRNPVNQTPLMIAAEMGLVDLVRDLIRMGANPDLRDNFGRTAFHIMLLQALGNGEFARRHLGPMWELLAPEFVCVRTDGRLRKLDRHRMEFLVTELLFALLQSLLRKKAYWGSPALETGDIIQGLRWFPPEILPAHRRCRDAITDVLARHEMFREGPGPNKRLFLRVERGRYVFNPNLDIRIGEDDWVNVYTLIGLDRMAREQGGALAALRRILKRAQAEYRKRAAAPASQPRKAKSAGTSTSTNVDAFAPPAADPGGDGGSAGTRPPDGGAAAGGQP